MTVAVLAALTSLLALASGIAAVGSGAKWQFEPRDILKGQQNALLYIWVTLSTIFSLVHTAAIVSVILIPEVGRNDAWFWLDTFISLLFVAAHGFIYATFARVDMAELIGGTD